jgi:hypothetical protein
LRAQGVAFQSGKGRACSWFAAAAQLLRAPIGWAHSCPIGLPAWLRSVSCEQPCSCPRMPPPLPPRRPSFLIMPRSSLPPPPPLACHPPSPNLRSVSGKCAVMETGYGRIHRIHVSPPPSEALYPRLPGAAAGGLTPWMGTRTVRKLCGSGGGGGGGGIKVVYAATRQRHGVHLCNLCTRYSATRSLPPLNLPALHTHTMPMPHSPPLPPTSTHTPPLTHFTAPPPRPAR